MTNPIVNMYNIDAQIKTIDKAICSSIEMINESNRGYFSQAIVAQLRNFVEHIMLKIYANGQDIENSYDNICTAIDYAKKGKGLRFLGQFHSFLQESASHYTLREEDSERLMLKYYEYLIKIKIFLKSNYSFEILENLDKFPLNTDPDLKEYYEKIADRIVHCTVSRANCEYDERFYIQKIKPFFVNNKIYYEVTFSPIFENPDKFNRMIAFTNKEIPRYYATMLYIAVDKIQIFDKTMPIHIIVDWETSIRPCEIRQFSTIFGHDIKMNRDSAEYIGLMKYLTQTGASLVELLNLDDEEYSKVRREILVSARTIRFFETLDRCRELNNKNSPGNNVMRYLLFNLNNRIIKEQKGRHSNYKLSDLYLSNGCIPFDDMPFNTSLKGHNPKLEDLFECLDATDRTSEILARHIRNNTEKEAQLYTPIEDVKVYGDVDSLIKTYNTSLWKTHDNRKLKTRNDHIFITEHESDTLDVLRTLGELTNDSIPSMSGDISKWVQSSEHVVDCKEKKEILNHMFEHSRVVLIRGPAGTGKSTLINHVSHFFSESEKLYLATTNSAVDNLRRKINAPNCTYSTIAKFLGSKRIVSPNVLVIDECSAVSNSDMRKILERVEFEFLILVGDTYQIEAIQFGNWFNAAIEFIPKASVFELTTPYRSRNKDLIDLWDRVRKMDNRIIEHIAKKGYSSRMDNTIFERSEEDEIILCLNYDGLYGINNVNRLLQQSNPNTPVIWEMHEYKVGDPILFNESERFKPWVYNNMKGRIVGIEKSKDHIWFDIEIDKKIEKINYLDHGFETIEAPSDENSIIRFFVKKHGNSDEDDGLSSSLAMVPFQVVYAISIHKAQGLEYDSVKIIITNEVDELITHDIFYTAITRAREKLKIYWTPEVEKKVLNTIKPKNMGRDVGILKTIY